MIEKLDVLNSITTVFTADNYLANVAVGEDTINKINEIIDILNAIVGASAMDLCTKQWLHVDTKDGTFIDGSKKAEPNDPYAEQRKWIGKLCKFWDGDEPENCVYGVLRYVFDLYHKDSPFQRGNGDWYEYCEPVSEDLFYKTVRNNKNVK